MDDLRRGEAEAGRVAVPDLVGLAVGVAREAGHDGGVVVVSTDVDGPPLGERAWPGSWVVTGQAPAAGTHVRRWDEVRVTFRRAGGDEAGDRAPMLPAPSPDGLVVDAVERDH